MRVPPRIMMLWSTYTGNNQDLSEEDRRARDRQLRVALTALMSMVAKAASVTTALATVPLTLHYLGPERYGMWMVMSSLVAMLAFADLGIGNGLLNTVAAAHGHDDQDAIRKAIASGLASLTSIAFLVLVGLAIAYPFVPWYRIFNVASLQARADAGPAMAAFFVCFALAIPANVIQRVQFGLQRGFLASVWQCVGSVLSLIFVLLVVWGKGGLFYLVMAFLGGPLIANTLNSIVFFTFMQPAIMPRLHDVSRQMAQAVMQTGLLFLLLQITTSLIFNADSIIISQVVGPTAVPQYSIPERMFGVITTLFSMALAPLWPAYREALMRGDVKWIMDTLKRSMMIGVGCALAFAIPLVLLAQMIISAWIGKAVQIPFAVILGFGLWKVIEAAGFALAMFLNGLHVIREQVITAVLTAATTIVVEVVLVHQWGVAGAIWGKMLTYIVLTVVPFAFLLPGILRRVRSGEIR